MKKSATTNLCKSLSFQYKVSEQGIWTNRVSDQKSNPIGLQLSGMHMLTYCEKALPTNIKRLTNFWNSVHLIALWRMSTYLLVLL